MAQGVRIKGLLCPLFQPVAESRISPRHNLSININSFVFQSYFCCATHWEYMPQASSLWTPPPPWTCKVRLALASSKWSLYTASSNLRPPGLLTASLLVLCMHSKLDIEDRLFPGRGLNCRMQEGREERHGTVSIKEVYRNPSRSRPGP